MTRLQQRIRRRKLKRLAVKAAQKACICVGISGIILCILAESAAKNPVSTMALAAIYFLLGILLMWAGVTGWQYFLKKERRERRHERQRVCSASCESRNRT